MALKMPFKINCAVTDSVYTVKNFLIKKCQNLKLFLGVSDHLYF